jgi:hypothetical protein
MRGKMESCLQQRMTVDQKTAGKRKRCIFIQSGSPVVAMEKPILTTSNPNTRIIILPGASEALRKSHPIKTTTQCPCFIFKCVAFVYIRFILPTSSSSTFSTPPSAIERPYCTAAPHACCHSLFHSRAFSAYHLLCYCDQLCPPAVTSTFASSRICTCQLQLQNRLSPTIFSFEQTLPTRSFSTFCSGLYASRSIHQSLSCNNDLPS